MRISSNLILLKELLVQNQFVSMKGNVAASSRQTSRWITPFVCDHTVLKLRLFDSHLRKRCLRLIENQTGFQASVLNLVYTGCIGVELAIAPLINTVLGVSVVLSGRGAYSLVQYSLHD